jgi:hypothetical protein
MSNDEFKVKMDIDNDDSIIYVKIPHTTVRRAVAGVMTIIVGFLGIIGLKVELKPGVPSPQPTEVQR